MFEVKGKYCNAIIYSDSYEDKAVGQIIELCNQDFITDAKVRIMPDYHYGAGCTIGFTANLGKKVIANLVGVDIGCGMFVIKLGKEKPNLEQIDEIMHRNIPSGFNSHDNPYIVYNKESELLCLKELKKTHIFNRQIGTLGGGEQIAL